MTLKLVLLAALAISLYLFPTGRTVAQSQETLAVRGQVVNGTQDADIPDSLTVLMLVTDAGGILAGTGQTKTDAQGRFVMEDVPVQDGVTYTFSVEHEGVFYGAVLAAESLTDGPEDGLLLTVYETTLDASIIHVERQVMVVAAVDKSQRLVSAIEFVRIVNRTDRTLLPDLTNVDPISFLRFALPPGTSELTVQSDLPGGDVASIGTGFALTSPVIPGAHSIDFSYTFPYDGETLSYRQSLVQGADIFQVLVSETIPNMAALGLNRIDSVNIQGASYRAYEGRDFPPGQGLQLELTGLPLPGVWARFSNSVSGGPFWQVAIPSALGATLAAMLLWGLLRGYRPQSAGHHQPLTPATSVDPAERGRVVRAVAALDRRFQTDGRSEDPPGGLTDAEYRTKRQELTARVLPPHPEQTEQDAESAEEGPASEQPE